jgi:hypothetical protein
MKFSILEDSLLREMGLSRVKEGLILRILEPVLKCRLIDLQMELKSESVSFCKESLFSHRITLKETKGTCGKVVGVAM